jgi:hypothetical protein
VQRASTKQQPDFGRTYEERNWFVFAQDTFRLTPRLALNFGLRYERFGEPRNTGAQPDTLVQVQPGTAVWQLSALVLQQGRQAYRTNGNDWGPRFGVSWDLTGSGRIVVRAGYGIFFDHPFDNLWQTVRNNAVQVTRKITIPAGHNYLGGVPSALTALSPQVRNFPNPTLFDPNFRDGYAQTFFAGIAQRFTKNLTLAVNGTGSLGRRLVTTDIINRQSTTKIGSGRLDPGINSDITYRAPQGSSHYSAATALVRGESGLGQWQAAYTWSHAIDNQSEALSADEFNLLYSEPGSAAGTRPASFSRQFDSGSDRGNSDFDQRHNFVFYSIWNLPQPSRTSRAGLLLRNWRFAQLAAFRSGFPYTVYSNGRDFPMSGLGMIFNNRANLFDPAAATPPPVATGGGVQLLNPAAFQMPDNDSTLGNSGRNAFVGPGLYNLDISLSRSFALPRLGESSRLTVRADAFNALNHANLGSPDADLSLPKFGMASFGRKGRATGFPAVFPLDETARQIQLILRVQW